MLDFGKARNLKTERTNQVNAQHGLYPAEISGEISTFALFHDKYTTDEQNNHIIYKTVLLSRTEIAFISVRRAVP
jgi:hypothetical protein